MASLMPELYFFYLLVKIGISVYSIIETIMKITVFIWNAGLLPAGCRFTTV
jgi:hypothetical protein